MQVGTALKSEVIMLVQYLTRSLLREPGSTHIRRRATARPAGARWPVHDRLQSVQAVGELGALAANVRGFGGALSPIVSIDRRLRCSDAPACCGWKTGRRLALDGRLMRRVAR